MSPFRRLNKKIVLAAVFGIVLLATAVIVVERNALRSWYYVRQLTHADEKSRVVWVERVAGLGEPVIPSLLGCLADANPAVCANARAALAHLTKDWGLGDARTVALAMRCERDFKQLSPAGQQNVLKLAADWFREATADAPPAQGLLPSCVRFLAEASSSTDVETQTKALYLCAELLGQPQREEALVASGDLLLNCLSSTSADNRLRAVQLSELAGRELLRPVASLLSDPEPEVRCAAINAVALAKDVVLDDALLPCLHDPDPFVRHLCETALIKRERTPQQIHLGFLLTAPDPAERIRVLDYLRKVPEIDGSVWVARMSHDPSPAIRAAAARMMSELNMMDRLEEMVKTDPSATVCTLAKYYLENPERRGGLDN